MEEIKQIFSPEVEGKKIIQVCETAEFIKNIMEFFNSHQFEVAANAQSKEYIQGAMWGISMAITMANINTSQYFAVKEE